jgi:hypothetical protein
MIACAYFCAGLIVESLKTMQNCVSVLEGTLKLLQVRRSLFPRVTLPRSTWCVFYRLFYRVF